MPLQQVVPRRRIGILEVRHKHIGPRVERIDEHLALRGAGDFNMAALQIGRDRRDVPRSIRSDVSRLRQKIGQLTPIDPLLPLGPFREQIEPARLEARCSLATKLKAAGVKTV